MRLFADIHVDSRRKYKMSILLMAIVLILIVVATVITKKLPFNFVLMIVPIVCALLLGHSVKETSDFVAGQLSSMMQSAGFMLLFAFLYFQMLTEAGVFDTIVMAVTKKLGKKMNVIVIMVLTTLIGGFSILTGNFTPAYLITFPILVPLYKEFDFDREAAFIIAQTAMSALCFIPWGIGMAYTGVLNRTGCKRTCSGIHALGDLFYSGNYSSVGIFRVEA